MKKAICLMMIVAVMAIFVSGFALAAADAATEHSKACEHASENAKNNANDNSVVGSCNAVGPGPID